MTLLSDKDATTLKELFKNMRDPVRLVFFSQTFACQYCKETKMILQEVADLSENITIEEYNLVTDAEAAKAYGIEMIPAIAVIGNKDYGIRFLGIPSGYEFTSLVEDIMDVSKGEAKLEKETLDFCANLDQDVDIKVFITPTCPYCPAAVRMAHTMAIASDHIRGAMVESIEFPQLANKYKVMGVPRIIINDDVAVEGAVPEALLVARIKQAVGLLSEDQVDALFEKEFGSA